MDTYSKYLQVAELPFYLLFFWYIRGRIQQIFKSMILSTSWKQITEEFWRILAFQIWEHVVDVILRNNNSLSQWNLQREHCKALRSPRRTRAWLTVVTAAWVIWITSMTATMFPSASNHPRSSETKMTGQKAFHSSSKRMVPLSTTGRCKNFPSCMVCRASTIGVSIVAHSGLGVMTCRKTQSKMTDSTNFFHLSERHILL